MATPILIDLKKHFPDAEITALAPQPILDLLAQEVSMRKSVLDCGQQYDVGILLTNSFSSAWQMWRGNVRRRIGYAKDGRSLLLTDRIHYPRERMHQVDRYKKLLEPLGIAQSNTAPHLTVTLREKRFPHPLIGIHPGASYGTAKCWPQEHFRSLALRLKEATVLFLGDKASIPLIDAICQELPAYVINLAGKTTLQELNQIINECDLLVTNDSGPMHIAAALKKPLVALFGSTDERATGPWGQMDGVINKHVACAPCFRRTCPRDFMCMRSISVDEVVEKIQEKIHVSNN